MTAAPIRANPQIPAADVAGGSDSRYLPRYDDARLLAYDTLGDEQATLPSGPFRDFGFTGVRTIDGEVTRLAYVVPRMVSSLEVMRFFRDALSGAGFTTVFSCAGAGPPDGCGGFDFGELLTQPMVEAHAGDAGGLIIDFLHPVGDDVRYVLATSDRPEGRVTLGLAVARHVGRDPGIFIETVCEPLPSHPPAASMALIEAALRMQGRIALPELHFAPGKATLSAGWRPVLEQAAELMQAHPDMRLMIVGHTDDAAPLADAVALSGARAHAVMQALLAGWKIPADRLTAIGIGPAAPLTSGNDAAGRALNQRIELVAAPPAPPAPSVMQPSRN
nr:OmpA family protein [uncultured Lichenicoccus sp.]